MYLHTRALPISNLASDEFTKTGTIDNLKILHGLNAAQAN